MRTSRTRALVLVATLSLGTFAFAQQDKSSFGSLTGEFQSAPVNSVPDNGGNGSANANTEADSRAASYGSLTGDFEASIENQPSNQPASTGADADALADRPSEEFSSLTGNFEAAIGNPSGNSSVQAGSLSARKSRKQPSSMGSTTATGN